MEAVPALWSSALHPPTCLHLPPVHPPLIHPSVHCLSTHPSNPLTCTHSSTAVRLSVCPNYPLPPSAHLLIHHPDHPCIPPPARPSVHPCSAQSAMCHAGSRHRAPWSGCSSISRNTD